MLPAALACVRAAAGGAGACSVPLYVGLVPAMRLSDALAQCVARVAHELCRALYGGDGCTLRLGKREHAYTIDVADRAWRHRVVLARDARVVADYARGKALLVCHVADRFALEAAEQRVLAALRPVIGDHVAALLVVPPQALGSGDRAAAAVKADDVARRCMSPRCTGRSEWDDGAMLRGRPFARGVWPLFVAIAE